MSRAAVAVFTAALTLLAAQEARALIVGGEGNDPINDPGWPNGAAGVFNVKARVAWWEGPPFGGGEWHGEYRGDAAALNDGLKAFARIDAPKKRLIVLDGVGRSFWLNPNRDEAKRAASEIDWTFVVWQTDRWKHLRRMPADLRPRGEAAQAGEGDVPVPEIVVYAGGRVRWEEVKVPEGVEVVDRRLEAHGFRPGDGTVFQGTVTDLAGGTPLPARVTLQKIEPRQNGGYDYPDAATTTADANGRWVLKSVPEGWYRIVAEADGYVPRVVANERSDAQPRWAEYDSRLAKPAPVAGRVTDADGKPLPEVNVRLDNVVAGEDELYESPSGYETTTDAEGRFRLEQVPQGKASVWVRKPDYVRPGLGPSIETPAADIALQMVKAAKLVVTVAFVDANRPAGYAVNLTPEGGNVIGSYGGGGDIDATGSITFENVPPGKYVVTGRPNPGADREQTDPVKVELRGGETKQVTLTPK